MKPLRILLIDDSEEVLIKVSKNIGPCVQVGGLKVNIEVNVLHIEMDEHTTENGTISVIKEKTIRNLCLAVRQPLDYIFTDFGYVMNKSWNEDLRNRLINEQRDVTRADIEGHLLQLMDLIKAYYGAVSKDMVAEMLQGEVRKNFLEHQGTVFVYTNSPGPFDGYFKGLEMNIRKSEVSDYLPKVKSVELLLMHDIFAIKGAVASSFHSSEAEKKFYTEALSKYIDHMMRFVALEYMVNSQGKLRFQNTKAGAKQLITLGLVLGAISALLGEIVYHLIEKTVDVLYDKNKWTFLNDWSVYALLTVVILILGYLGLRKYSVKIAKETEEIANSLSGNERQE